MSTIIIHQDYNVTINDNDVAVLVLSSLLRFKDSVTSASIPIQGETLADNSTVVALGWGRTIVSVVFFTEHVIGSTIKQLCI